MCSLVFDVGMYFFVTKMPKVTKKVNGKNRFLLRYISNEVWRTLPSFQLVYAIWYSHDRDFEK